MNNLYFEKTTVRWSDLDANRHLANASYMNFTSFARVAFLKKFGVSLKNLEEYKIGPAVLNEQFSFFKEVMEGDEVYIGTRISGMSEDGMIYQFTHDLYNKEGFHICHSELLGVWFSSDERKMIAPPENMVQNIKKSFEDKDLKVLTKQDIKDLPFRPENINPSSLQSIR